MKLEKYNIIDGKKEGPYISYNENGSKNIKCNYSKGILVGRYISFYNNKIREIRNYINGEVSGYLISYYNNGYTRSIDKINIQNKSCHHIFYHENGKICIICDYINNQKNGYLVSFYDTGKKHVECNYIDDKLVDFYIEYDSNNQTCKECYYIDDKDPIKYEHKVEIVFKSCKNYIVYLQKLYDTITNETRHKVYDKQHAKFRGNKFLVVKIIHKVDNTEIDECANTFYENKIIKYIKNKIIEEKNYDYNKEIIDSEGIHYFLTEKTAKYFEIPKNYSGHWISYNVDGTEEYECSYHKGVKYNVIRY